MVRWQGEEHADSWVDDVTLASFANEAVVGFDWDRMMLADETDHSSDSDSDSNSEAGGDSSSSLVCEPAAQSPVVVEATGMVAEGIPGSSSTYSWLYCACEAIGAEWHCC